MIQKNTKKASENMIDSDDSVIDNVIEYCLFVSVAEQAQRYSDYFDFVINTCF